MSPQDGRSSPSLGSWKLAWTLEFCEQNHAWENRDGSWILVRGPSRFWPHMGALSPKFTQNRGGGVSLNIAWKVYDFAKILGVREGPGPKGPLDPLWKNKFRVCFVELLLMRKMDHSLSQPFTLSAIFSKCTLKKKTHFHRECRELKSEQF